MDWTPALPAPPSSNWREAYGAVKNGNIYTLSDTPTQTSYQAPSSQAVPFVYDGMKITGGESVDTAEYPFYGLWSSTALNEKPHNLSVSGFLRGDEYIKKRNALIEALRIQTSDDNPGYLSLPLWGRFPVIVVDWDIEESAKEAGQCKINLSFVRAGCPAESRWEQDGGLAKSITEAAETVKTAATQTFDKKLTGLKDNVTFIKAFSLVQKSLISIVGRIQGAQRVLNDITNKVCGIGNLLSQDIRSPKSLAQALFGAAGSITASIFEIKNTGDDTIAFFRVKNNEKNTVSCFLANDKYTLPVEAVTIKQEATKTAAEQLYKTASLYAAAMIIPGLDGLTYSQAQNLFALYDRLEKSIDLNAPELYTAVNELRSAVAKELAAKQLSQELVINLHSAMPILAIAKYLGTEVSVLRQINRIEDSFVVLGTVRYV